ncbi:uncharacterized protein LOC34624442 [Cyclospora cayetanensis]|uniref:diacylglycerol kinase (ATP) n=1 Tax=Cyclospora cayetanensis TaxID=88456 RepID=A0A6P6RTM6_9EIME|nr:uncharacterized protein LOC34624442 [Cyclospora cayetanensis]
MTFPAPMLPARVSSCRAPLSLSRSTIQILLLFLVFVVPDKAEIATGAKGVEHRVSLPTAGSQRGDAVDPTATTVVEPVPSLEADDFSTASLPPLSGLPEIPSEEPEGQKAEDLVIPRTRAEAEVEAAKWVCGARTELYFLFANPVSGSRLGAKFLQTLPMGTATSGCVELKIFSQTDSQSEHLGIQHIIQAVETVKQLRSAETTQNGSSPASLVPLEKRVRVIAVGGDGAFTWMMMAISKAGTDMEWVASGIIPSGTGNDLAHTYGWVNAGFPSHAPLSDKNIQRLLSTLRSSELLFHDFWKVTVVTDSESGSFNKWSSRDHRSVVLGSDRHGGRTTKRFIMSNYFGIGFEGLVGSVFDRMRGKSRFWNRLVYGLLFLRFASTDLEVCSAIDTIYTLRASGLLAVLSNNPKYKKVPRLMPCVSLTFLNTRTILGGLELWRPTVKVGVLPPADPAVLPQFEHFYHQLLTAESSTGDGMLEVLSMESTADYFNAQVVGANAARRILQGSGPFMLTFRDNISMAIQVDGEFYLCENIRSISIQKFGSYGILKYAGHNESQT